MSKIRTLRILSPIIIVCAIILLIHDFLAKETSFLNLYLHGGMLVVGVYFLYLANKRQSPSQDSSNKKVISLNWFVVFAIAGLLFTFFLLYVIEGYPIWTVSISVGVTAIFLVVIYIVMRRLGRFQ